MEKNIELLKPNLDLSIECHYNFYLLQCVLLNFLDMFQIVYFPPHADSFAGQL